MIYNKVVEYCEKNKLSITEFESRCGLGNGTVGKWKDGKFTPGLKSLEKIAKYTGISIDVWIKSYGRGGKREESK